MLASCWCILSTCRAYELASPSCPPLLCTCRSRHRCPLDTTFEHNRSAIVLQTFKKRFRIDCRPVHDQSRTGPLLIIALSLLKLLLLLHLNTHPVCYFHHHDAYSPFSSSHLITSHLIPTPSPPTSPPPCGLSYLLTSVCRPHWRPDRVHQTTPCPRNLRNANAPTLLAMRAA